MPIRIGVVGAGANTRSRHIPGFRALTGVEVRGVVNRSPESTTKAAQDLGIPKTYPRWQDLISDPEIDAVCIGTWPYLHCEITCAALAAGKHVLTEARMANDAAEARRMLATSQANPNLVAQIVPSPFGLLEYAYIRKLLEDGYLGDLREMVIIGANDVLWDSSLPLHWRQDRNLSGLNIMTMGILHEAFIRWFPDPVQVYAQATTFEPLRPAPDRPGDVAVTVPDSVQVLTQFAGGGRGIYHLSGITVLGPGQQLHLYGTHGTLKFDFAPQQRLQCGRVGDTALRTIEIPEDMRGGWRVEAEFIGAIRGDEAVKFTDFATGVRYMEFTDAVSRSIASEAPIKLPLT